jgi:hypothetical protein
MALDPHDAAQRAMAEVFGRVREATQQVQAVQDVFTRTTPRAPKRALAPGEVPAIATAFRQRFAELVALRAFLVVLTWTKEDR